MSKRHNDALFIWAGACNPSGIARSIADACAAVIRENGDQRTDPAVRLMVAQLAYLVGVWDGIGEMKFDTERMRSDCEATQQQEATAS